MHIPLRPDLSRRALLWAPLLLWPTRDAAAHAVLVSSTPAAGATIAGGRTTIVLRFNSRVDHGRSRLILLGPDGNQTVLSIFPTGEEDVLSAIAIVLPGGQTVRWQVLAGDGHITRGEVAFKAVRE